MVRTVKEHQASLVKEISRLEARKSKLFETKDVSKWEIRKRVAPNHVT